MSKKSFRENNPALQFITHNTDNALSTNNTVNTNNTHNTDYAVSTHDTSKASPIVEECLSNKKAPVEDAPRNKETKSKRLNLLIQPSLHADLSKIAYMERISLNELILRAAKQYVIEHQETIEKYELFMGM